MSRLAQSILEHIASGPGGVRFTAELAAMLDRRANVIATVASNLKRRGLIRAPQRGRYQLTDAGRKWLADGKVVQSGQGRRRMRDHSYGLRERAWWLMRERRKFTIADLLDTLADGTERDAFGNLCKYVRALERVGIVQRMRRRVAGTAPTSNGAVLWLLKRDLGRKAPVWRHREGKGHVYDPNAAAVIVPPSQEAPRHDD